MVLTPWKTLEKLCGTPPLVEMAATATTSLKKLWEECQVSQEKKQNLSSSLAWLLMSKLTLLTSPTTSDWMFSISQTRSTLPDKSSQRNFDSNSHDFNFISLQLQRREGWNLLELPGIRRFGYVERRIRTCSWKRWLPLGNLPLGWPTNQSYQWFRLGMKLS